MVRNNAKGREAELLKQFGEPSWANPSARVVDPESLTTHSRLAGDYSRQGLLNMAASGLAAADHKVPAWLALHVRSPKTAQASFAMGCFWTGEVRLGGLEGVISTRTGWRGGSEVVEVEFDPAQITREALTEKATQMSCSRPPQDGALRPTPKDDKYQIRSTALRFLPLSPTQATRVNARLGRSIEPLLSPRQLALWGVIQANPDAAWPLALGKPLASSLQAAQPIAASLAE